MLISTLVLVGIALVMGLYLLKQDKSLFIQGLRSTVENIKKQLPLLVMAFLLVGFLEVLVPVNMVQGYLGEESGIAGIITAGLMGAAIPAGPYIVFPLASAMETAGAAPHVLIAFITGWMMLSASALPFELSLMGPRFTLKRVSVFILFPVLAGLLALWFL